MDQGEQILTAALKVMDAVGYEAASLRDVAEKAGVALGSIYRYFPEGKRQLLQGMTDRLAGAREAADLPRRARNRPISKPTSPRPSPSGIATARWRAC